MVRSFSLFSTGTSDFESISVDVGENSADIRLYTINDAVTLEYDDAVLLRFNPSHRDLIEFVEQSRHAGDFVRDTATVKIIDNDSK